MRRFIIGLFLAAVLAGSASAAVQIKENGTVIGLTESINVTGPTITKSGSDVTINTLSETGDKTITGSLTAGSIQTIGGLTAGSIQTIGVDERIYGTTYITELLDFNTYPDKLHLSPALAVDNSVYVGIGISGTNTTSLYIRQPDGGCSKCGVDAAGTAWACTNATTCASVGM